MLLTILSFAVQSFKGGDILRLFKPVAPVTLRGFLQLPPLFLGWACPHTLAVDYGFFVVFLFVISNVGYEATPLQAARVLLSVGRSIPHQRGRQMLSFLLTHSLSLMYMLLQRSAATSHYLRSSPILSGCSGRCPWQKLQLPIFPLQGRFTGGSLGDHLTIFLLCWPLSFTSGRGSLVKGRAGTPVPCMTAACTQGNTNLWCDEKKLVSVGDAWPSVLVCHFIRGDVSHDLRHHLPSLFFPPILDLPLSIKSIHLH